MRPAKSEMLKLLVTIGLLAAAGIVMIRSGLGLPGLLLSLAGLAALFFWFIRKPQPQGDMPSAAVSCCHYLGDPEETYTRQRE
jgi:hypothetical protein